MLVGTSIATNSGICERGHRQPRNGHNMGTGQHVPWDEESTVPTRLTSTDDCPLLITRTATIVMSSGMPPPHMMSFSFASSANGESRVLSSDSSLALTNVTGRRDQHRDMHQRARGRCEPLHRTYRAVPEDRPASDS